jgi:excisionase family DNA binding protein
MTNETGPLAPLLTVDEVCLALRQARPTIYRKLASGELRGVRLGRSPASPLRVPVAELERYLASSPTTSTEGESA